MSWYNLEEAIKAYKKAARIALALGGAQVLGLGSAKLIDALDSIVAENFGVAATDIWHASSMIMKLLAEQVMNHYNIVILDSRADTLFAAGEYTQAYLAYSASLQQCPIDEKFKEMLR